MGCAEKVALGIKQIENGKIVESRFLINVIFTLLILI